MLIALLVVLGVNLIIVVLVAALVIGRRRWLKRQPGQFAGAIRVSGGQFDGLKGEWQRGSGRWVRDILAWSKAPFMYRDVTVTGDQLVSERSATNGELKHLGEHPVIIEFASDGVRIEVATRGESRALAAGPLTVLPSTDARPPTAVV
jgi:Protein of unknown function (DUF2550)